MAEVLDIGWRERLVSEFLNDREEVMQRANGAERRIGRVTEETAGSGQQEGAFDQRKREVLVAELNGEAAIVTRVTVRRLR
jgi:hypothetical protein